MNNTLKLVYVHEGVKHLLGTINSDQSLSINEALNSLHITADQLKDRFADFNYRALLLDSNIDVNAYMDNVGIAIFKRLGRATTQADMEHQYNIQRHLFNKYYMLIADPTILLDNENSINLINKELNLLIK